MSRYDWDWNRGYDRGYPMGGAQRGYGAHYSSWGDAWSAARESAMQRRGTGPYRPGVGFWEGGYDRGMYGGGHPGYGGHPGGPGPGMYYGGWRDGGGYPRGAGYDRSFGWGRRASYDDDYAAERFVPEDAYRRHPELDLPRRHGAERWPEHPHRGPGGFGEADDEIQQAVRESLHQDAYIDADRIQVEVKEQVVTLRGEVDDYLEARYAWDDAWETAGVRGVVNQITVRTDVPEEPKS